MLLKRNAKLVLEDGSVFYGFSFASESSVSKKSLADWLKEYSIPGIYGVDTRELTKKLREKGTMLGKIIINDKDISLYDPNKADLVKEVTIKKPIIYDNANGNKKLNQNNPIIEKIRNIKKSNKKIVVLIDCGVKNNIIRNLLKRDFIVIRVPYDYDFFKLDFDGIVVSNGPGDPKMCKTAEPALPSERQPIGDW